jgi:hypothetical protein
MKKSILDQCENLFGSLQNRPDIKKRIYNYFKNPTYDNWDNIHCIIIKNFQTIWNAMIAYDPSFPKQGRTTDEKGNVIKEWERIPTPFELMKAIQQFVR